jgi:two-component system, cell cycle response regulator DivK
VSFVPALISLDSNPLQCYRHDPAEVDLLGGNRVGCRHEHWLMATKPSILIVDDSADSREMLAEYLAFRGFTISDAKDGEEAIEVARRVRPTIILMDLSMPRIDGWEATRQLKADPLTRHSVIIAVTAHAFAPERQAAQNAGCDAFVLKPYDLAVLANTLDEVTTKGPAAFGPIELTRPPNRSSRVRGS